MNWEFGREQHQREAIQRFADAFGRALTELIDHCLQPDAGGCTPSDFPLVEVSQAQLDALTASYGRIDDMYPLTPLQEGLLYHWLMAPQLGAYVVQVHALLQGDLDIDAFHWAWQHVGQRHALLRTAIVWEDVAKPVQLVQPEVEIPLLLEDWRDVPAAEQADKLQAYLREDRRRGFDLQQAPLLRLALLRLAENRYRLVWTSHHVIEDGWSVPILLQELFTVYQDRLQQQDPKLPDSRPFRDYVAWLGEHDTAAAEAFWRDRLAGYDEPARLSIDATTTATGQTFGEQELRLPAETTAAVERFARAQRLTLNTVLQGAWALVLSRYSGSSDRCLWYDSVRPVSTARWHGNDGRAIHQHVARAGGRRRKRQCGFLVGTSARRSGAEPTLRAQFAGPSAILERCGPKERRCSYICMSLKIIRLMRACNRCRPMLQSA